MDCSNNDCCFNSKDNTNDLLILQLKEEIKKLLEDTQAQLLLQNKKIAETCIYVKENLSNEIRLLLDTMQNSGELDDIITTTVLSSIEILQNQVEYKALEAEKGDGFPFNITFPVSPDNEETAVGEVME